MECITKQMIEQGLNQNIIKPCMKEGRLAVNIGDEDFWFWIGSDSVDSINVPHEAMVHLINNALSDFRDDWDCYDDEYMYYYYYLMENIK